MVGSLLVLTGMLSDGLPQREELRRSAVDAPQTTSSDTGQMRLRGLHDAADEGETLNEPIALLRQEAAGQPLPGVQGGGGVGGVDGLPGGGGPGGGGGSLGAPGNGEPADSSGPPGVVDGARDPLAAELSRYDWDPDKARSIVMCETGGAQYAVGALGERGPWQIHPLHSWRFERRGWAFDDAFDWEHSTAIAYELYSEQGFAPWTCSGR